MSYVVEPLFLTQKTADARTPDIVASSESGWLAVELTTQLGSKEPNLRSYMSIDPRYLAQHGLHTHGGQPDVIRTKAEANPRLFKGGIQPVPIDEYIYTW